MPWQEKNAMTLRKEMVLQATAAGANISDICRRYKISRPTAYKWIGRHQEGGGSSALEDHPKTPQHSPKKTCNEITEKILAIRKEHPRWGGRKIEASLKRSGEKKVPVASCINKILHAHGLTAKQTPGKNSYGRFEHDTPNSLWQMDFKGYFQHAQGYCYPLTILDDHSRFSLAIRACDNERGATIKPKLIEVFERYGIPDRINVDNGNPWGTSRAEARFTTFSKWLITVGIRVSFSRPGHPQTNGKIERFHRTLKAELLNTRHFNSLMHAQEELTRWRDVYNLERPHQAIDYQVPADRYQASYRCYKGEVNEYDYAEDYLVKRGDKRGRIVLDGRAVFIGIPFAGELVGIRQTTSEDIVAIYFQHQKLGEVDLARIQKGGMINLYSGRALVT